MVVATAVSSTCKSNQEIMARRHTSPLSSLFRCCRHTKQALEAEDEAMQAGERAGQRAALLEVARAEEGQNQVST